MKQAPLYNDLAEGPEGGAAYWLTARDGVRLRAAYWPGGGGGGGTVFLFPGRTEYIEKYGRAAASLHERGFGTISIDWRCQGLADRLDGDVDLGHVERFSDYQMDVDALVGMARELDCPRPWYLVAHSMGGCIGLRSLHLDMPVNAVAFTGPMWGILAATKLGVVAWPLFWAASKLRGGRAYTPTTVSETAVLVNPFEDNELTTNADMYEYIQGHARQHRELAIGGPSSGWFYQAMLETRELGQMDPPDVPALTFLGGNERIVDADAVHKIMAKWSRGELVVVEGAEHEVMMETPERQTDFFDRTAAFFAGHGDQG